MAIIRALLIILLFANSAWSATLWVNQSGSNTAPYDTKAKGANLISTAIAAASAGDTINLSDGTYDCSSTAGLSINVGATKDGTAEAWYTIKAETDGGAT